MKIKLITLLSVLLFTLSACSNDDKDDVSLEKMGKQADEKISETSDAIGNKMDDLGDAMEKKGQEISDAVNKQKDELEKK